MKPPKYNPLVSQTGVSEAAIPSPISYRAILLSNFTQSCNHNRLPQDLGWQEPRDLEEEKKLTR